MRAKSEPWPDNQGGNTDTEQIDNRLCDNDSTKAGFCQVSAGLSFLLADTEPCKPITMPVEEDPLCEHCGKITLYDRKTDMAYKGLCRRRGCPNSRKAMAKRIVKQIKEEFATKQKRVPGEEWAAYKKTMQRSKTRFKSFPQKSDGSVVVVQDKEGVDLPTDEQELADAVEEFLKDMPDGKRTGGTKASKKRGTEGFGGRYWSGGRSKGKSKRWARIDNPWSRAQENVDRHIQNMVFVAEKVSIEVKNAPETGRMNLHGLGSAKAEEVLRG